MDQDEIMARVTTWQAAGFAHPLTCGKDSSHQPLVPMPEGSQAVVLVCLDCGYRQTYIPPSVLNGDLGAVRQQWNDLRARAGLPPQSHAQDRPTEN